MGVDRQQLNAFDITPDEELHQLELEAATAHTRTADLLEPLTPQEAKFVAMLCQGLPKKVAAEAAGYTAASTPYALMKKPRVLAALEQQKMLFAEKAMVNRDILTVQFYEERAKAATAGEGIAALREIGRLHGLYEANKVEVTKKEVTNAKQVETLSVDELIELSADDYEELAPQPITYTSAEIEDI